MIRCTRKWVRRRGTRNRLVIDILSFALSLLSHTRNLPIAIILSCTLCTAIYALTIVAFHTTLSVSEVLTADAVAGTFAERLFGGWQWVIPVFVALSTFGGVNGILFTSSRSVAMF